MAKKSIILDNGDGRVAFSNTASVSVDDVTTNISASILSASSISLSNIAVGTIKLLSASNGIFTAFPDGIANGGAIAFDGTKWVPSTIALNDYIGTASGDLSGTFESDVKVVNISNVSSGTLPVAFGGTGKSLTAGQNYVLEISKSINSTPVISALQGASGSFLTSVDAKWLNIPPGYPDVRFYTSGSSGNTFTWNKPAGARFARVILQGAGGGGGGSGTNAVALYNGGGGGAGAFTDVTLDVSSILSATIMVGIGGIGGLCGTSGLTVGSAGTATYFSASGINVYANPGSGGNPGTSGNNSAGGAGGSAMSITAGGYSKAGGAGSTAGGTANSPEYTIYGACGGGSAGGFFDRATVVPMINSTCFGYNLTSDGVDISSLNFVQGTNGSTTTPVKAGYGAGGAARAYNNGALAGSRSDEGGNGYIIVISW